MTTVFPNKFTAIRRLGAASLVGVCFALAVPAVAQDSSISLDLNDDAVRLSWQQFRPERQFSYEASILNHQDRGLVATGGFHITGNAATKARPISAGLGGRLVYADAEDTTVSGPNGYALAVGGFFRGQIPN